MTSIMSTTTESSGSDHPETPGSQHAAELNGAVLPPVHQGKMTSAVAQELHQEQSALEPAFEATVKAEEEPIKVGADIPPPREGGVKIKVEEDDASHAIGEIPRRQEDVTMIKVEDAASNTMAVNPSPQEDNIAIKVEDEASSTMAGNLSPQEGNIAIKVEQEASQVITENPRPARQVMIKVEDEAGRPITEIPVACGVEVRIMVDVDSPASSPPLSNESDRLEDGFDSPRPQESSPPASPRGRDGRDNNTGSVEEHSGSTEGDDSTPLSPVLDSPLSSVSHRLGSYSGSPGPEKIPNPASPRGRDGLDDDEGNGEERAGSTDADDSPPLSPAPGSEIEEANIVRPIASMQLRNRHTIPNSKKEAEVAATGIAEVAVTSIAKAAATGIAKVVGKTKKHPVRSVREKIGDTITVRDPDRLRKRKGRAASLDPESDIAARAPPAKRQHRASEARAVTPELGDEDAEGETDDDVPAVVEAWPASSKLKRNAAFDRDDESEDSTDSDDSPPPPSNKRRKLPAASPPKAHGKGGNVRVQAKLWEQMKPYIHTLYVTQGRTLGETITEMGRAHNFISTYVVYPLSLPLPPAMASPGYVSWTMLTFCLHRESAYRQKFFKWKMRKLPKIVPEATTDKDALEATTPTETSE